MRVVIQLFFVFGRKFAMRKATIEHREAIDRHSDIVRQFLLKLLFVTTLAGGICSPAFTQEVMPLDSITIGMEGTWDTVVSGDELETFRLKVLGVSPNFVGPRKAVIICEALDDSQILNGPVAGMSGSPVYIDGKLVGAYAYGYGWSKEQTIIGVTPIESMIEIVDRFPPQDIKERYRKSYNNGSKGLVEHMVHSNGTSAVFSGQSSTPFVAEAQLPFPVYVSGISPEVLSAFDDYAKALGVTWTQVPSSTTSGDGEVDWTDEESLNLRPGMPVAGVLMGGDFSMTGVGTVTWKKGNRLLGFGHPFFGGGDVEIPMAAARVITVVRSLQQSFKMTNIGPVVGSIYQDRLTGIAGEVGRVAPTTDVQYQILNAEGNTTTYKAQVFEHSRMSPLLSAIGLLQSLQANLDADEKQTLYLKTQIKVKGQTPIYYENTAIDAGGATQLAIQLLNVMAALSDNPFEYPKIESIRCEVEMLPVQHFSFFDEVTIESDVPASGENLDVNIRIRNYLGEPVNHELSIPIPIGMKGEELTLQIADASQVDPQEQTMVRADMDTLSDIVRQVNQIRSSQNIYVRLLKKADGFQLQGDTMVDLPPSITHLFSTPKNAQYSATTTEVPLWETSLPTSGVFSGSYRLNIEIK